jgi:hypothetical protein
MLSSDAAAPVDRPNLSKDYLAGSAPEEAESVGLRSPVKFFFLIARRAHLFRQPTKILVPDRAISIHEMNASKSEYGRHGGIR